jgi:flagellar motor switch protein FliM
MTDVLDQSDIDALLKAVADGDVETSTADARIFSRTRRDEEGVEIREHDFKRPERISKDQMRSLQQLHETFARSVGVSLSGLLRTIVEVRVSQAEQMTYSEYITSLPNPTCFNLVKAPQLEGQLCLEISPLIIYPLIDRLLGGNNQDLFIPQRAMTLIEGRLVHRILSRSMTALTEAWEGVMKIDFELGEMESNPQLLQIVPPNEVVAVIGFEIKMINRAGTMNLCIPFNVIEPLMEKLAEQSWFLLGKKSGDPKFTRRISAQLSDARVGVSALLAHTTMTMAELLSLAEGDLIVTEKSAASPIVLCVEGQPKFLARPGQHRGNNAVQVIRATTASDRL